MESMALCATAIPGDEWVTSREQPRLGVEFAGWQHSRREGLGISLIMEGKEKATGALNPLSPVWPQRRERRRARSHTLNTGHRGQIRDGSRHGLRDAVEGMRQGVGRELYTPSAV